MALVSLGNGHMSQNPVPMHRCPGAALLNTLCLLKKLQAVADCVTPSPSATHSDLPVEMFFL